MAFAAALDAFVHVADLFAAVRTRFTDCRARFAVERVVVAVTAHEINACPASGDAIKHSFDVGLLDVISARGQAVARQHVGTSGLALLATLKALLHRCGGSGHHLSPVCDQ